MKIPALPKHQYAGWGKDAIRSHIRKQWMSWPVKHAATQRQAERITTAEGRQKTLIRCAHCAELFDRSEIQVNHKHPVGALASTDLADIQAFRARMFRPVAELEACCTPCHLEQTKQQLKGTH